MSGNPYKDKVILVTGGTGSIGAEIVKQLLRFNPKQIRVLARGEYGHHVLTRSIKPYLHNPYQVRSMLGDIRDKDRLRLAMDNVDIVFHAAALKHVDICEANPFEVIQTNVAATQNMIDVAREKNVELFIGISSDKAVHPTGIMGTSKLMMEKLITNTYWYHGNRPTKFACVRFGNVLGSSGSILPIIKHRVSRGQSIQITDPEMTRFFMTIPQAVSLVLDAARHTIAQEIFVLKMPSLKIGDLIETAVEYYAQKQNIDPSTIPLEVVGPRAGEKMHEELLTPNEATSTFETDQHFIVQTNRELFDDPAIRAQYPKHTTLSMNSFSSKDIPPLTKEQIRNLIQKVEKSSWRHMRSDLA